MTESIDIARRIDHTCLRADARGEDIARLCTEAVQFGCAAACVNPRWVERAAAHLVGSGVAVCSVVGFPLGATSSRAKAVEAERAARDGATELDMVIDLGGLLDGLHASVRSDIECVRRSVPGALLKVIVESACLDEEALRAACGLAMDAGADFVKTSTGFGPGGATEDAIRVMREVVGPERGVKASGGIRDRDAVERMFAAGASRIGTSSTGSILGGAGEAG